MIRLNGRGNTLRLAFVALMVAHPVVAGEHDLLPLSTGNYWSYVKVTRTGFSGSTPGDTTLGPVIKVFSPVALISVPQDTVVSPASQGVLEEGQLYYRLSYGTRLGWISDLRVSADTLYVRLADDGSVLLRAYSRADSLHIARDDRTWLSVTHSLPWEVQSIGRDHDFLDMFFFEIDEWNGRQLPQIGLTEIPQDKWLSRSEDFTGGFTSSSDRMSQLALRFVSDLSPGGPNRLFVLHGGGQYSVGREAIHLLSGVGAIRISGTLTHTGSTHYILQEAGIDDLILGRAITSGALERTWGQIKNARDRQP